MNKKLEKSLKVLLVHMSGTSHCVCVSPAGPLELQCALINRVLVGGLCITRTPTLRSPVVRFLCAPWSHWLLARSLPTPSAWVPSRVVSQSLSMLDALLCGVRRLVAAFLHRDLSRCLWSNKHIDCTLKSSDKSLSMKAATSRRTPYKKDAFLKNIVPVPACVPVSEFSSSKPDTATSKGILYCFADKCATGTFVCLRSRHARGHGHDNQHSGVI